MRRQAVDLQKIAEQSRVRPKLGYSLLQTRVNYFTRILYSYRRAAPVSR